MDMEIISSKYVTTVANVCSSAEQIKWLFKSSSVLLSENKEIKFWEYKLHCFQTE